MNIRDMMSCIFIYIIIIYMMNISKVALNAPVYAENYLPG